jgi:glycosyltransferase involved in cell wall biosynthesis
LRIGLVASVGITLDAFFLEIVRAWEAAGHQVYALAGTPSSELHSAVEAGITRQPNIHNVMAPSRIKRWAHLHRLDVIVTNTATASTLVRLSGADCPVIYFCHGLHWNQSNAKNFPVRMVERALLTRTDGVITINSDDESWFRRHGSHLPILRLPSGVGLDLDAFPDTPLPTGISVLWVGEFSERKRPLDALYVANELRNAGVDFHMTILGDGPLAAEVAAVRSELGLEDRVDCPGHQPVQPFLASSSVVLHTARWEGLPRVLLEATAMARPVVGYDVKGVRDIRGAALVPDGDVEALARAVVSHRVAPPREPARQRAELSVELAAAELEQFLCDAVGEGR